MHRSNKNYPAPKVYGQEIQRISQLQAPSEGVLFTSNIGVEVDIEGKTRFDIDNILKAILDGLQGVAFENDRQVKECHIKN